MTIVSREILDHLRSAKFLICLGITAVLVVISMLVNIQDYRQRRQDHLDAQREMKGDGVQFVIFRKPSVLSTLIQGKDRTLGSKAEVSYMAPAAGATGYMGEGQSLHSRYAAGFMAVDFGFIVRIVLSLAALFLAYDAVSGEKAAGTLRLVLSNPVPRDKVLLGKFLGGLFVVGASLFAATAISLILLLTDSSIALGEGDWRRIAGIVAFSALYLVFFYTLGLYVSVIVNRPSTALIVLVQAWAFLVVLHPNVSTIAAANLRRLPSPEELEQRKQALFEPHRAEYQQVWERFRAALHAGQRDSAATLRWTELWILNREMDRRVDEDFSRKQSEQARLAEWIALVSPAALYDQVTTRYARTDMEDYDRFMDGLFQFWRKLADGALVRARSTTGKVRPPPPTFSYAPESSADSVAATIPQWLVLSSITVLFFLLAYFAFLKKDVR